MNSKRNGRYPHIHHVFIVQIDNFEFLSIKISRKQTFLCVFLFLFYPLKEVKIVEKVYSLCRTRTTGSRISVGASLILLIQIKHDLKINRNMFEWSENLSDSLSFGSVLILVLISTERVFSNFANAQQNGIECGGNGATKCSRTGIVGQTRFTRERSSEIH